MYFVVGSNGIGNCWPFNNGMALSDMVADTGIFRYGTEQWGVAAKGESTIQSVMTKASIGHPNKASTREGYIALKRSVLYTDGNVTKADVFKVTGWPLCIAQ